jgi:multidrug efflux pump subunit AcrA (membrane-fusion protein)
MDRARHRTRTSSIKHITGLVAGLLLLVAAGVALARIDFRSQRVDRDKVSIDTVQRGTLEVKVSANGELLSKNVEEIGAQVTGRVARKHVRAGDVVVAGQLLVELTNPQLVAGAEEAYSAWEGAVAELKADEADLQTQVLNQEVVVTQAQFDLERAALQLEAETQLIDERVISAIDYRRTQLDVAQLTKTRDIEEKRLRKIRDNVEVQMAVRQSRVDELARALERARDQAAGLRAVAGIAGIVQSVNVDVGEQLQPGTPIGRIAQQDALYAELEVPAREAGAVRTGQAVLVDTRSGTVDGVVTRVDPGVNDGTVVVDVDLRGELPAGARPHLPIEGVVYVSRLADTLYVGKPAYVKTHAAISVYKLDADGRYATRVTIETGDVSLNYLQVLQGLAPGDRIITSEVGEWQDEARILLN